MRPRELVEGNCYFQVTYSRDAMVYPLIQTLIYRRSTTDDEGVRYWVFEDAGFEGSAVADPDPGTPVSLHGFPDDQLCWILDFPGLARTLADVAAHHPLRRPEAARPIGPDSLSFRDLESQVGLFLGNPESPYLAITIKFTDDGLSLTRFRGGRLSADFHVNAGVVPDQESRIRALFNARGVAPQEDYLANGGRIRMLSFPVDADQDELVGLCRRVLMEAFSMEAADSLVYAFGNPAPQAD
jgi:hypothetical protein